MRELTSVSFLGPLLEKTALEIILANKPVAVTTTYQHSLNYTHGFDKKDDLFLKDEAEDEFNDKAKKFIRTRIEDNENNIGRVLSALLHRDKEVPAVVTRIDRPSAGLRGLSEISGSASEREVIYRPRKPKLPSWIAASAPFNLELEFYVSTQGEINRVIPVVSSGNAEVDLLAVRYLKSWKFAPLAQPLHGEQKGKIKFIFNE